LHRSKPASPGTKRLIGAYYGATAYAARGVGIGMYPLLYWAGVATLIVWSAYSAYSALIG
jgi:hypothetical protein